jgi:hypothetical protein
MRAQKMRKETAEKERDEYFNITRPVILMKQEWRMKEKVDTPALTTSNNYMNLLDDDEAPLIKDESPPPTGVDINMVFTLSAKFRAWRRRSLRFVSALWRSCLRNPRSRANT